MGRDVSEWQLVVVTAPPLVFPRMNGRDERARVIPGLNARSRIKGPREPAQRAPGPRAVVDAAERPRVGIPGKRDLGDHIAAEAPIGHREEPQRKRHERGMRGRRRPRIMGHDAGVVQSAADRRPGNLIVTRKDDDDALRRSPMPERVVDRVGDGGRLRQRVPGPARLDPAAGIDARRRREAKVSKAGLDAGRSRRAIDAISQMCPSGSRKLAVRIPHGLSIGPFRSSTPRRLSSAHTASTSSTPSVNWNRTPASRDATVAGSTSCGASLVLSRLTSVWPNVKTAELSSSNVTGNPKTSP